MKKILSILMIFITALIASHKYTNDLIYEESPYLLQHAHNPISWLPWGNKAFEKAKREHKPIFLSIGYSTCHWCHVMERESFENEEIAKFLNENFVPIKVDKEERPDLDRFYQKVYQVMHKRSGGWPLTIIMTEELKPFFAATFIPLEDGYGVKGMKTILPVLAKAYKEERETLEKRADAVLSIVKEIESAKYIPVHLDLSVAKKFVNKTLEFYDKRYKGFSKSIKFPESSRIRTLLDIYLITKDIKAKKMAIGTLKAMANGGIYDQVNGAFFRYTTDRRWEIPHFEKMLYTNAELIDVYAKAYKLIKEPIFEKVVKESIEEIDSRFSYDGLYFSASDADTEGIEGGFFIFDYQDTLNYFLKRSVDKKIAIKELSYFSIEEDGNIDGEFSNPHINPKIELNEREKKEALKLLKEIRKKRKYPFIDRKIITAWNAMYIDAKLNASYIEKRYKDEAIDSLEKLIKKLYKKELYHYFIPPNTPSKKGLFEDYAYLIKALISAYEYTLDKEYLKFAEKLEKEAKKRFFIDGKWYLSDNMLKSVVDLNDGYYTSPLSIMLENLLSLASLSGDLNYLKDAKYIIDENSALIFNSPESFPEAVRAVLRFKVGDVIIKNRKVKLLKDLKKILDVKYPYILIKEEDIDRYLACRVDTCFADNKDLKKIIQRIKEILNFKEKKAIWKANER